MMAGAEPEKLNIQWFPGHMAKARRMIEDDLRQVDAVCELLDARIPRASRNPDIDKLCGSKPRLVILSRADLADPVLTDRWAEYYRSEGLAVIETDAKSGRGMNSFVPAVRKLLRDKLAANAARGLTGKPLRIMILGIPNVGKSTFINKAAGRRAAAAGDRPGVTRGRQWISMGGGLDLLDTPGILWPKFDSQEVGELLAVTNAVNPDILDKETLSANFLLRLARMYPQAVADRYKFQPEPGMSGFDMLSAAARKRGFLIAGGELDTERMANVFLNEYHEGKLGRMTLEVPDD